MNLKKHGAPKRMGLPNQTKEVVEVGSKTCTNTEPGRQGFSQIFSQESDGNVYIEGME